VSISSCVRSGAEGETGVGVVRKGRAATRVAGAFLLGLALVHVLVLVLGDGVKASAVGNAKEMTSSRSSSGLVLGMMTKKLGGGRFLVLKFLGTATNAWEPTTAPPGPGLSL